MATSSAKEVILKKIRQALSIPVPVPFPHSEGDTPVYTKHTEEDDIVFAEVFTRLQGKFAFCADAEDLSQQLLQLIRERGWTQIYCREKEWISLLESLPLPVFTDLAKCDVAITGCEYLVARTGSIVMSTAQESGRTSSIYAPIHICIAYNRQMVYDLKDVLLFLKEKYTAQMPSMITFASGPSRTADIEKTLVTGVHGPKEVYCFLVES